MRRYQLLIDGIGLACLYILKKVEIWSGDTDPYMTDWRQGNIELLKLLRSRSGALVTQSIMFIFTNCFDIS